MNSKNHKGLSGRFNTVREQKLQVFGGFTTSILQFMIQAPMSNLIQYVINWHKTSYLIVRLTHNVHSIQITKKWVRKEEKCLDQRSGNGNGSSTIVGNVLAHTVLS